MIQAKVTHTPAPWTANDSKVFSSYNIEDGDFMICRVDGETYEVADANARLIAAAPELLEALEHLLTSSLEAQLKAKALIARVKGDL